MNAMISEFQNRLYTQSIIGDWLSLFVGKTKEEIFFFPEGVLTILYTIHRNCSGQEKNFPPKKSMYPYTVAHRENQRRHFFFPEGLLPMLCTLHRNCSGQEKNLAKKICTNYTSTVYFYAYCQKNFGQKIRTNYTGTVYFYVYQVLGSGLPWYQVPGVVPRRRP